VKRIAIDDFGGNVAVIIAPAMGMKLDNFRTSSVNAIKVPMAKILQPKINVSFNQGGTVTGNLE